MTARTACSNPTKGYRLSRGRVSPEAQKRFGNGGGFAGYARLQFDASGLFPGHRTAIVLAARDSRRLDPRRGRATTIAPSRRLYAGGGGSVRGFGYQQFGPKDADNNPVGGRSLTEFAMEARYRFGNFGIVPFFDAGQVGEGFDADRLGPALRRGHRWTLLHQFRADAARHRHPDRNASRGRG